MVSGANILPIACLTNETIDTLTFTNQILAPVRSWRATNPTKHPQYIILFPDMPTRVWGAYNGQWTHQGNSISFGLSRDVVSIQPFITSINMGGTNTCMAYINKLVQFGSNFSPGKLIISAGGQRYGNTNYYFDDTRFTDFQSDPQTGGEAMAGVLSANPTGSVVYSNLVDSADNTNLLGHITVGTNVAGYLSWGSHSALGNQYSVDRKVRWVRNSGWWIVETVESGNGEPTGGQGNYWQWYSLGAFGGTNYENTPVGAVTHVDEPYGGWNAPYLYFGLWEAGKSFGISAWNSARTVEVQAVGDPFVTK
jgi:hypothetical protein